MIKKTLKINGISRTVIAGEEQALEDKQDCRKSFYRFPESP